jgi:hypothetical protein
VTRLPRSPGLTLVLRLYKETVHDFISLFLPPCGLHLTSLATGSLEPGLQAYLSSPYLEASPAITFRASSSPTPTPVKPQLAHAILCQESVHTMLSITHHTRKRPTTGPRTTQALNLPLDVCIDNTHILVTKEKKKRRETTKSNSNKRSKAKGKAKSKIT